MKALFCVWATFTILLTLTTVSQIPPKELPSKTKELKEDKIIRVTLVTEKDSYKTIVIKDSIPGDIVVLSLYCTDSYRWYITKNNEEVLTTPKGPVPSKRKTLPQTELGIQERFIFTIIKDGMSRIEAQYRNRDDVAKTKVFKIQVE